MKNVLISVSVFCFSLTMGAAQKSTLPCVLGLVNSYCVNFGMDFIKTCSEVGVIIEENQLRNIVDPEYTKLRESLGNITRSAVLAKSECSEKRSVARNLCRLNENRRFAHQVSLAYASWLQNVTLRLTGLPRTFAPILFKFVWVQLRQINLHVRGAMACFYRASDWSMSIG